MSDKKTMTFERFQRGSRSAGFWTAFIEALVERKPVEVPIKEGQRIETLRTSVLVVAERVFHQKRRVVTRVIDGTLYACLMPDAGNSK